MSVVRSAFDKNEEIVQHAIIYKYTTVTETNCLDSQFSASVFHMPTYSFWEVAELLVTTMYQKEII